MESYTTMQLVLRRIALSLGVSSMLPSCSEVDELDDVDLEDEDVGVDLDARSAEFSTIACEIRPFGLPKADVCSVQNSKPITSVKFEVVSPLHIALHTWDVKNPDGTPAQRISRCGVKDEACEVKAAPVCLFGPAFPEGFSRVTPAIRASHIGIAFGADFIGDASAVFPPDDCTQASNDSPPMRPPIQVFCGADVAGPRPICSFDPNICDFVTFSVPTVLGVSAGALQMEWETDGAPIVSGCGPTSNTCTVSTWGAQSVSVGATAVDTTWGTWSSAIGTAISTGQTCGAELCLE